MDANMSVAEFKNTIMEKGFLYTMPSYEKEALISFASKALERKITNIVCEIDTVPKKIREDEVKAVFSKSTEHSVVQTETKTLSPEKIITSSLNKLSENNFQKMSDIIQTEIDRFNELEKSNPDKLISFGITLINLLKGFTSVDMANLYSQIFAMLFHYTNYTWIKQSLNTFISSFINEYDNYTYYDSEEQYDEFCANNDLVNARLFNMRFVINLYKNIGQNGEQIITIKQLKSFYDYLFNKFSEKISIMDDDNAEFSAKEIIKVIQLLFEPLSQSKEYKHIVIDQMKQLLQNIKDSKDAENPTIYCNALVEFTVESMINQTNPESSSKKTKSKK